MTWWIGVELEALPIHLAALQSAHVDVVEHPDIQGLDALIKARLDAFGHQAAAAAAAEVVLHALFAEAVFLDECTLQSHCLKLKTLALHVNIQRPIASANGAVAFYNPALRVVERW